MNISDHAKARSRQRGIPWGILDVVLENGTLEHAPGGVYKIVMSRKDCHEVISQLKQILQSIEKARDCVLVIDETTILTTYKRY